MCISVLLICICGTVAIVSYFLTVGTGPVRLVRNQIKDRITHLHISGRGRGALPRQRGPLNWLS